MSNYGEKIEARNWYKRSQQEQEADPIQVSSWNHLGELVVLLKGKRYVYQNATPPIIEKIGQLIRRKNWSAAFAILRSLSPKVEKKEEPNLFDTKPALRI